MQVVGYLNVFAFISKHRPSLYGVDTLDLWYRTFDICKPTVGAVIVVHWDLIISRVKLLGNLILTFHFQEIYGTKYSRIDQVRFVEDSKSYHFKFFKGCASQISLGPFLNTLFYIFSEADKFKSLTSYICCYSLYKGSMPLYLLSRMSTF